MSKTPEEPLPQDRELALHEINSLIAQLRAANIHTYSTQAFRRDRILGWFFLVLIIGSIAAGVFYQYASSQSLRQSLYQSCQNSNAKDADTRTLYMAIAGSAQSDQVRATLTTAAANLKPRDCAGLYLR